LLLYIGGFLLLDAENLLRVQIDQMMYIKILKYKFKNKQTQIFEFKIIKIVNYKNNY
jgi:hypothetical protein